jgi:hypothetical protein
MKLFLLSLLSMSLAGCMYNPAGSPQSHSCKEDQYDCNMSTEAVRYMRYESFFDCDGKLSKKELQEYNGNSGLLHVPTTRNISVVKAEFTNLNNGTKAQNQAVPDGGWPVSHYDRQYVKTSGSTLADSLRLEKGINRIHYVYYSCANEDCSNRSIQEEGDRNVLALFSKVANRSCERHAKCSNGVFQSWEPCSNEQKISPQVLEIDYGMDVLQ